MPRTLSALSHELVGLGSDCVAASGASGVVLILCRMSRVAKAFQAICICSGWHLESWRRATLPTVAVRSRSYTLLWLWSAAW